MTWHDFSLLSVAAAAETAATATAWRESDAHALDGIAPLREAQLAVGTDLERIGRARCQVVHRSCLLRTRNGRGSKRGGRCTTCPKSAISYFIMTRSLHRRNFNEQFAALALIDTRNLRLISRGSGGTRFVGRISNPLDTNVTGSSFEFAST